MSAPMVRAAALCIIALAACACHTTAATTLHPGMRLDSALDLLRRENLDVAESFGDHALRRFDVSSPHSNDALCFSVEDDRLKHVYWYRNWRNDRELPKGKRADNKVEVQSIDPQEIRAQFSKNSGS